MTGPPASTRASLLGLTGFIVVCLGVSWIAAWATSTSVGWWYPTLVKPDYTPPDGAFGPVWVALYLLMALAGWRVWRKAGLRGAGGTALTLFAVQLWLNLIWSVLFFGLQHIGLALADIVLLWFAIAATIVAFFRIDRFAAVLLLPYLAWVGFAALLNYQIWRLN